MEFLKELLGETLYAQLVEKINAHNGKEENKDKQVKLENINSGNYVSKMKYDDTLAQLTGKQTELDTANGLIAELKKGTKGNEELQGKITGYETQVTELQKQLQETKLNAAIMVALLSEKAVDVDYLTYKLREKGENLELDENDKIKGWNEKLSALKTQCPTMFEKAGKDGLQVLGDNKLPDGDNHEAEPQSLAEAIKASYETN